MAQRRVAETHEKHAGGGNRMNKNIKEKQGAGGPTTVQGSQTFVCSRITSRNWENVDYLPHAVSDSIDVC